MKSIDNNIMRVTIDVAMMNDVTYDNVIIIQSRLLNIIDRPYDKFVFIDHKGLLTNDTDLSIDGDIS